MKVLLIWTKVQGIAAHLLLDFLETSQWQLASVSKLHILADYTWSPMFCVAIRLVNFNQVMMNSSVIFAENDLKYSNTNFYLVIY
jgi:hypothetical protein